MLRSTLLSVVCLLPWLLPTGSFAQQPLVVTPSAPVSPIVYESALRERISLLAQQERALKLQGQPPGFHAQLITAAALGGAGAVLGGATLLAALVTTQCDCGPSLELSRGLMIGGYAAVGVAGIWAITLTGVRRARTDRSEVRRLHEERRGLQQEYKRMRQAYPAYPITVSLLLAPQQIGLRATY